MLLARCGAELHEETDPIKATDRLRPHAVRRTRDDSRLFGPI